MAGIGPTKPDAGVMATSPATQPEMAPRALGLPLWIHSAAAHEMAAAAAAKCVATNALVARLPALSALPALKSEPSHPQQARPDEAEHDAMRQRRLLRISDSFSQVERAHQRGDSRGDVHHRAAGEIERREASAQCGIQQPALAPHHVRHGRVHDQRPQHHEQRHGAELHALGEGPADERRSDDGKHQLVNHEGLQRNSGGVGGLRRGADAVQEQRG